MFASQMHEASNPLNALLANTDLELVNLACVHAFSTDHSVAVTKLLYRKDKDEYEHERSSIYVVSL